MGGKDKLLFSAEWMRGADKDGRRLPDPRNMLLYKYPPLLLITYTN